MPWARGNAGAMGAPPGRLTVAAYFAACFVYLWAVLDPSLVYVAQEPAFYISAPAAAGVLSYPGEGAIWVGRLLTQGLVRPAPGAAILTLCWLLLWWSLDRLVGVRRWLSLAAFIPVILALSLRHRFGYSLALDLALVGGLLVILAWRASRPLPATLRALACVVLAPPVYWFLGGAFVFTGLAAGLTEVLRGRRWLGLLCWTVAGLVPWIVGMYLWAAPAGAAYGRLMPFHDFAAARWLGMALYGAVLALIGLAAAVGLRPNGRSAGDTRRPWLAPVTCQVAVAAVLIAAAGVACWASWDGDAARRLRIDQLGRRGEWGSVLAEASQLQRSYTPATVYRVHRALWHAGHLLDEMFAYPVAGPAILVPSVDFAERLPALSEVYLDLGLVNRSEHMAHEALEIYGDRPSLLQRLVTVNLLKGRSQAASVFLGLLDRGLVAQDWVRAMRPVVAGDRPLTSEPELRRVAALAHRADYPGYAYPIEDVLLQLLRDNASNRMAYEYLVAHYLLAGQLERAMSALARLDDYGDALPGPGMPRHCEEAALLYMTQVRRQSGLTPPMPVPGRSLRPQTLERYQRFSQILAANRRDRVAARRSLAPEFGDTYWFYYLFRLGAPERGETTT